MRPDSRVYQRYPESIVDFAHSCNMLQSLWVGQIDGIFDMGFDMFMLKTLP